MLLFSTLMLLGPIYCALFCQISGELTEMASAKLTHSQNYENKTQVETYSLKKFGHVAG